VYFSSNGNIILINLTNSLIIFEREEKGETIIDEVFSHFHSIALKFLSKLKVVRRDTTPFFYRKIHYFKLRSVSDLEVLKCLDGLQNSIVSLLLAYHKNSKFVENVLKLISLISKLVEEEDVGTLIKLYKATEYLSREIMFHINNVEIKEVLLDEFYTILTDIDYNTKADEVVSELKKIVNAYKFLET